MIENEYKMNLAIKRALKEGKSKFMIYPYGIQGGVFKRILNEDYKIREVAVIDRNVKSKEVNIIQLDQINTEKYKKSYIFVVSDNTEVWFELRANLLQYVSSEYIIDVFPKIKIETVKHIVKRVIDGEKARVLFNPVLYPQEGDMYSVGQNTGNLVFAESIKENYVFDLECKLTEYWSKYGKENVFAIFAASNFINPYADTTWLESLIPIIEKSSMNITFAGLGAQGNLNQSPQEIVNSLSARQIYFFS